MIEAAFEERLMDESFIVDEACVETHETLLKEGCLGFSFDGLSVYTNCFKVLMDKDAETRRNAEAEVASAQRRERQARREKAAAKWNEISLHARQSDGTAR